MNTMRLMILFLFANVLFSCQSRIEEISNEENREIKVLKIRELGFQSRFKLAQQLYRETQEQYPSDEAFQVVTDYEIAFLFVKRKKYKEAKALFEDIISRYDNEDAKNNLPQWPFYLSIKVLEDEVNVKLNRKLGLKDLLWPDASYRP